MLLDFLDSIQTLIVSDEFKNFKKLCNDLRCPLCGSQLDGNIHPKEGKLYCASNNEEYKCTWFPGDNEPYMEYTKFWYYPYEYLISCEKVMSGDYHTMIDRYDMDASLIHKSSTRVRLFSYKGPRLLAFRQRMEAEQFLKKLKTVMVFS